MSKPTPTPRKRGYAAVEDRKRRRALHPLCCDCLAEGGRVTLTQVIDHVIPLAKGGPDSDDNVRGLCRRHHLKRTAEQFNQRRKVACGVDGWPLDEEGRG
jgi:5-methylcytosine-specific restriction protein A